MKPNDPTVDLKWVRDRFSYCPETGVITHNFTRNSVKAGDEAGNLEANGYIRVRVRGHKVLAHRLAMFLVNGEWPAGEVDHKNRIRSDNRLTNLRIVTSSINAHNKAIPKTNTSGAKGVQWRPRLHKWQAIITIDRKRRSLGHFFDFEDAVAARREAERDLSIPAVEMAKNGKEAA